MSQIRPLCLAVAIRSMLSAGPLAAQAPALVPLDSALRHVVGQWMMSGTVRGKPVTYTLVVTPTLRQRYVELHITDLATPSAYEARVIIGADTTPGRYLAHWLDSFGAAYSVPPGTGAAQGDTLTLDFPYPTGTFHDTFVFDRARDAWVIRLEKADGRGGWTLFADYRVSRARQ